MVDNIDLCAGIYMERNRFNALDSWRGIAALAVVAFHFRRTAGFDGQPFVDGMFLFVDFFFVLSGFVIFAAYGKRLAEGDSVGRFLWLRLGRIYPLHIFTLAAFILLNAVIVFPVTGDWFPAPRQSWDTVVANLLLVQSWGFFDFLTWNQPSWSISTEFFAYLAFAAAIPVMRRRLWIVGLLVIIAAPAFLFAFNDGQYLDATWGYGIVRCLYGFSVGIVIYEAHGWLQRLKPQSPPLVYRAVASVLEVATVAAIVAFISSAGAGPLSLAAPLVFGLVVIVFAQEAGVGSRVLLWRPFAFVGLISYSIYMVHMLILSWWLTAFRAVLFKLGGRDLFENVVSFVRAHVFSDGRNYIGMALMLVLVIVVGAVTYRLIERPFREWSRRSEFFMRTDAEVQAQ